jgi:hypothetical protein
MMTKASNETIYTTFLQQLSLGICFVDLAKEMAEEIKKAEEIEKTEEPHE